MSPPKDEEEKQNIDIQESEYNQNDSIQKLIKQIRDLEDIIYFKKYNDLYQK